METFAKLIGTAISGADCKYLKLHFPIDSRLRGNDGRFCKGLLMGEESKARVKTRQHQPITPARHTGFKAVSTGRGENKTTPTDRIPLSLDGRGIKGEGEINTPAPVTDCTRITHNKPQPGPSYWL